MERNDSQNQFIKEEEPSSIFSGGMLANYFIKLATLIVSLITLGLAYPAMVCWKLKWEASHTYLNGQQLTFDGKAMQLMGKYVLWMFLSIITLGLYYIFSAKLKLTEWQTKHTHFANYNYDEDKNESKFNGKWYQLFAVNFVCRFVTIITLFIGYYWAHCYKERWYCKHKTIDGYELEFDGTGMQYFGKRIIWTLLTIVTLGIYSFWLQIKSIKWTVSHTKLVNMPSEGNFLSEEALFAFSQKNTKKTAQINCLIGMILLIISSGIMWIYYIYKHLTINNIIRNFIFLFGLNISYTISLLFYGIYIFFAVIGWVLARRGYEKIDQSDLKSRRRAVFGFIFGVISLNAALYNIIW